MPTNFALLALVFTSAALVTGATMSMVLTRWSPERRRLAALVAGRPAGPSTSLLIDDPSATFARLARMRRRSPASLAVLRRRLVAAGYGAETVGMYGALELGCAVAGAVLPLLLMGSRGFGLSLLGVATGMLALRIALTRRIERRRSAIRHGLPDALDMLVVCLDAGCTLSAAIGKVSEELQVAHPALAHELAAIRAEVQAGKPKADAFQHLADRTQVDEIRPLVTLLMQTERFGTGIGAALRTHAESSRDKRSQRAEEQASKAGVKMVFPLVLCIFPAFYVITLGPVIIHFVRVFFSGGILAQ